ncbi:MAG: hypothetical protein NC218_01895 [Acetobacter sp.]|nr:hypothetical protein [Acetobacter sp.]
MSDLDKLVALIEERNKSIDNQAGLSKQAKEQAKLIKPSWLLNKIRELQHEEIKVGDYVEGIETIGVAGIDEHEKVVRGWVTEIRPRYLFIKADDCYGGARGTLIPVHTAKLIKE